MGLVVITYMLACDNCKKSYGFSLGKDRDNLLARAGNDGWLVVSKIRKITERIH